MNRRDLLTIAMLVFANRVSPAVAQSAVSGGAIVAETAPTLSAAVRELIAALAELIIPTTDTPGAIAAGVPAFIERTVLQWYTAAERNSFLAELEAFDAACRAEYGRTFLECTHEQQTAALTRAESMARKIEPEPPDAGDGELTERTPFFDQIKELTVVGYYTSQVGATQELAYHPVPGRYRGDVTLTDASRPWSS